MAEPTRAGSSRREGALTHLPALAKRPGHRGLGGGDNMPGRGGMMGTQCTFDLTVW